MISFTIWIVAALCNALLVLAYILFTQQNLHQLAVIIVLVFFFSLACSIPGILIFWLLFIVRYQKKHLFQFLLRSSMCIALATASLFQLAMGRPFLGSKVTLVGLTIIATTCSLMLHMHKIHAIHNSIK